MQQQDDVLLEEYTKRPTSDSHATHTISEENALRYRLPFFIVLLGGIIALIVLLILLANHHTNPNEAPIVTTLFGQVKGITEGSVNKYLGIPYALPPTGDRRWTAPQPNNRWDGVLNANKFSPACPQIQYNFSGAAPVEQSEDCLYLNVYTPEGFSSTSNYPVIFWIHGGAFVFGVGGSSLYDGERIVSYNSEVVVVSINYRLGVLGFLAIQELLEQSTNTSTGNYGIQDMLLALQWVKDNIQQFGGNPNKVTIWGESAGCNAVLTLLTTSYAKDLFRAAICNSGGYDYIAMPLDLAIEQGNYVMNHTGCATHNDPVNCLRETDLEKLLTAYGGGGCVGLPTIDGIVLQDYPISEIKNPDSFSQVPLMMGVNVDEATPFMTDFYPYPSSLYETVVVSYLISIGMTTEQAQQALTLYPLSDYPNDNHTLYWGVDAIVSDQMFKCGSRRFLQAVSDNYPSLPIYVYLFGYPYTPNFLFNSTVPLGAFHGSELAYIFQTPFEIPENVSVLANMMQRFWVEMVMGLSPDKDWPIYSAATPKSMYLDLPSRIIDDFVNSTKCDFWDSYPLQPKVCRIPS